jgi:PTH1 family peptidyl-tRNA hydrolase
MVTAELASRASARFKSHKTGAMVAEGRTAVGGPRLILANPTSYMNVSGRPVAALQKFYKVEPARIIVVHDELDIPFDSVKIKLGGGHGGHNGLRDIISAIGTGDFIRVRVGIGRPPGRQPAADFVLRDFATTERSVLPNLLADAADAVESIAADGLVAAQLRFHTSA